MDTESAPMIKYSSSRGDSSDRSIANVSTVYDGPSRSKSMREARKLGLSAMASSTIARRSSALKKVPGILSGDTRAGTKRTSVSASRTRASSAMIRCPM